jgi:hypothetical protein
MSNVIYLDGFSSHEGSQPQPDVTQRKFARALLLKLNAPKEGDITAILKPTSTLTDLECLLLWLNENREYPASPLDLDLYYELLCAELNDRLKGL